MKRRKLLLASGALVVLATANAHALGIRIPQSVLLRATEVIE